MTGRPSNVGIVGSLAHANESHLDYSRRDYFPEIPSRQLRDCGIDIVDRQLGIEGSKRRFDLPGRRDPGRVKESVSLTPSRRETSASRDKDIRRTADENSIELVERVVVMSSRLMRTMDAREYRSARNRERNDNDRHVIYDLWKGSL